MTGKTRHGGRDDFEREFDRDDDADDHEGRRGRRPAADFYSDEGDTQRYVAPVAQLLPVQAQGQRQPAAVSKQKKTVAQPQPQLQPKPLPIPRPPTRRRYGELISFVLCVLVPISLGVAYYEFIASDQYVSEFRFSVKDTSPSSSSAVSGALALLGGSGTGVVTENYIVTDYLKSRQAVEDLEKRIKLIERFTRPEIDQLSRFDPGQSMEEFVRYWQKMATANYDQVTGIATAQIRAFKPEDALLIATTMVTLAEDLVNQIANRTRADAVRFAESEVERAQERLRRVRTQLTDRARTGAANNNDPNSALLLDLERQVAQTMLASAMQTFDQARANAAVQHIYITPYVRPSLPQSSTYPRSLLSVSVIAGAAFLVWLIGLLVTRSIFDRQT